jgi:uncharacterized protein with HEPN domain
MIKDPRVNLVHILECIEKIERFTVGGRERFFADDLVQDAVLRNFLRLKSSKENLPGKTGHRRKSETALTSAPGNF